MMPKYLRYLHLTTVSLGLIAAVGIVFNLGMFITLFPKVTQLQPIGSPWETLGIVAGLNILVITIFHISGISSLLMHVIVMRKPSIIKVAGVVVGIISALMILSDLAMIQDIGHQYEAGLGTRAEWTILFINYALHVLFLVLVMYSVLHEIRAHQALPPVAARDEVVFQTLHMTGLICGIIGAITILAALFAMVTPWILQQIVFVIGTIILIPYVIVLGIWIFKTSQVRSGVDEKQSLDVSRAGLWTIIILLPLMVIVFILQQRTGLSDRLAVLWLPIFVFISLLGFSGITLLYSRR
jgi:hypothetical protein